MHWHCLNCDHENAMSGLQAVFLRLGIYPLRCGKCEQLRPAQNVYDKVKQQLNEGVSK